MNLEGRIGFSQKDRDSIHKQFIRLYKNKLKQLTKINVIK
jgi:hypothetical protein